LRRKAKAERIKVKEEISNLPHPSSFAFLLCPFASFQLPIYKLDQNLHKDVTVVDEDSKPGAA